MNGEGPSQAPSPGPSQGLDEDPSQGVSPLLQVYLKLKLVSRQLKKPDFPTKSQSGSHVGGVDGLPILYPIAASVTHRLVHQLYEVRGLKGRVFSYRFINDPSTCSPTVFG
ncbi:hypothetical protein Pmani_032761 [Petrolisthes manimaculis]|uniref:Uncharacterized protein n=1 Tax=Petrolisthes manimaculis TaxID=1843537 RepID=A0AAE1NSC7_9EUCA|nr:hypothetical protein Pmani_032761 [Petrolisthes manimaculis]